MQPGGQGSALVRDQVLHGPRFVRDGVGFLTQGAAGGLAAAGAWSEPVCAATNVLQLVVRAVLRSGVRRISIGMDDLSTENSPEEGHLNANWQQMWAPQPPPGLNLSGDISETDIALVCVQAAGGLPLCAARDGWIARD